MENSPTVQCKTPKDEDGPPPKLPFDVSANTHLAWWNFVPKPPCRHMFFRGDNLHIVKPGKRCANCGECAPKGERVTPRGALPEQLVFGHELRTWVIPCASLTIGPQQWAASGS